MHFMQDLSDYQLSLAVLLLEGNRIVCNEGANCRAWMEDKDGNLLRFSVRKDTANALFAHGWMQNAESARFGQFPFEASAQLFSRFQSPLRSQEARIEQIRRSLQKKGHIQIPCA